MKAFISLGLAHQLAAETLHQATRDPFSKSPFESLGEHIKTIKYEN